jgi:hypothetical protein
MAINLQAYHRASVRIDNTVVQAGTVEQPINFAVAGLKYDAVFSLANTANTLIYNNDLTDFEYLYIAADFGVRLLITDSNSDAINFQLRGTGVAERYGLPFILGDNATDGAGNTVATIRAINTSGNTAKVRILAID